MASQTVRVEGIGELLRALAKADKEAKRGVQRELNAAANIVRDAARQKMASLAPSASGRTVSGIRGRVRGPQAIVEQRLSKTTGKRGDWGSTQMHFGLLPARAEKYEEVVQRMDRMLGRLAAGF